MSPLSHCQTQQHCLLPYPPSIPAAMCSHRPHFFLLSLLVWTPPSRPQQWGWWPRSPPAQPHPKSSKALGTPSHSFTPAPSADGSSAVVLVPVPAAKPLPLHPHGVALTPYHGHQNYTPPPHTRTPIPYRCSPIASPEHIFSPTAPSIFQKTLRHIPALTHSGPIAPDTFLAPQHHCLPHTYTPPDPYHPDIC